VVLRVGDHGHQEAGLGGEDADERDILEAMATAQGVGLHLPGGAWQSGMLLMWWRLPAYVRWWTGSGSRLAQE
jgi:hypothetical protein